MPTGNPLEALAKAVRTEYRRQPVVREDCWPPVKRAQFINLAMLESKPFDYTSDLARYTVRRSTVYVAKQYL